MRQPARLAVSLALCLAAAAGGATAAELEEAAIHLEQNVTDGDAEIVLIAVGGDDGLKSFQLIGPNGRTVAGLLALRERQLGYREVLLETPEPSLGRVLKAYPAGTYRFVGTTFDGEVLTGEAELSHVMPAATQIEVPADGAEDVDPDDLVASWAAVPGVAGYLLEIEQDDLGVSLNLTLPAGTTSFTVPAGFLRPGIEYELGVATVAASGNVSFREIAFTTAE
jgi:hypothetical protein